MIFRCLDGPMDGAIYVLNKVGEVSTNRKPDGCPDCEGVKGPVT